MNTINRILNKPKYRVTRGGAGFNLHRRFLRFFYTPTGISFSTMSEVFAFVNRETGCDRVCVELFPPQDFQPFDAPGSCDSGGGY